MRSAAPRLHLGGERSSDLRRIGDRLGRGLTYRSGRPDRVGVADDCRERGGERLPHSGKVGLNQVHPLEQGRNVVVGEFGRVRRSPSAYAGGGRFDMELDAPREPPDPKGLDFGPG